MGGQFRATLRELARYPSALIGIVLIAGLVVLAVYTTLTVPYSEAVKLYREERPDKYEVPPLAQPVWVNLFRREKLPETIVLSTLPDRTRGAALVETGREWPRRVNTVTKSTQPGTGDSRQVFITFTLDYPYGAFPHDLSIRFVTHYKQKMPFVTSLVWVTPDGRELDLGRFSTPTRVYNMSTFMTKKREGLMSGQGGVPAVQILFGDPAAPAPVPLRGTYQLRVSGFTFEPGTDLDVEMLLMGKVYGLAGTDDKAHDLTTILLWGAPIALAFGLAGAVGTTLISMMLAAVSAWFGGWVDEVIQRLTEVNMILPTLPIAITVYFAFAKSVWVILGVIVALSIFGNTLKSMRAMFLQAKGSAYVEAAQAYGAGDLRIIVRYLMPRVLPLIIPRLVALIPTYVFLEATLAYLGVSDLLLPTWGRLVLDAVVSGALKGHYYWALEPAVMLLVSGAGFALLGFALERILNPRLRTR